MTAPKESRERAALRRLVEAVVGFRVEYADSRPLIIGAEEVNAAASAARALLAEPPTVIEPSSNLEAAAARLLGELAGTLEYFRDEAHVRATRIWHSYTMGSTKALAIARAADALDDELRAPRDMGPEVESE